jgi:hypothetical protein
MRRTTESLPHPVRTAQTEIVRREGDSELRHPTLLHRKGFHQILDRSGTTRKKRMSSLRCFRCNKPRCSMGQSDVRYNSQGSCALDAPMAVGRTAGRGEKDKLIGVITCTVFIAGVRRRQPTAANRKSGVEMIPNHDNRGRRFSDK